MGDAVDRLNLDGDLAELVVQVKRFKGHKASKLNLLAKSIKRFELDVTNYVVWQDFASCKRRADKYGEAYNMLLEAILAAI